MHRTLTPLVILACLAGRAFAAGPSLERVVIDDNFPGGYQVEVADVNGDGKPDLVALGNGTCAWYENPSWKKRIVTGPDRTPGIISTATADLDGDGKAEIAIAYEFSMNEPTRGKLLLAAQGKGPDDPWEVERIGDIGSIHRLRWFFQTIVRPDYSGLYQPVPSGSNPLAREKGYKGAVLAVAPIFGPSAKPPIFDQEPAHLILLGFGKPEEPKAPPPPLGGGFVGRPGLRIDVSAGLDRDSTPPGPPLPLMFGKWVRPHPRGKKIGDAAVIHAIDVVNWDGKGDISILAASNLGVTRHSLGAFAGEQMYDTQTLVPGAPGESPKKGASEVHAGKLKDGRRFLATVEPWHGTDVAVYLAEANQPDPLKPWIGIKFGPRTVIDATLKEGHALWVADLDGDGDDEILAGYRGGSTGVNLYHREGEAWTRTVVDPNIAAQDLRGGDLDGDGRPDVVAIGGKTHNVVWYRPMRKP